MAKELVSCASIFLTQVLRFSHLVVLALKSQILLFFNIGAMEYMA